MLDQALNLLTLFNVRSMELYRHDNIVRIVVPNVSADTLVRIAAECPEMAVTAWQGSHICIEFYLGDE